MTLIAISVGSLLILGLLAGTLLIVAGNLLAVKEDPKVEAVLEALPGANCGGCGFAGCEGYAVAVVMDPNISASLCCVGGEETSATVASLVGKVGGGTEKTFSFRRCVKDEGKVKSNYVYEGMISCIAAASLEEGPDECRYSCIGYGDCVRACQFDAMVLRDGMVQILAANCTSCGQCVKVCPHHCLEIIPARARVMIYCVNRDIGKAVTDVCESGCIGCLKCVRKCPAKAISLVESKIMIDHPTCLAYGASCGRACMEACQRKILRAGTAATGDYLTDIQNLEKSAEKSATETVVAEKAIIEKPTIEKPAIKTAVAEKATIEKPAIKTVVAEKATIEKPAIKTVVAEKATIEKPTIEKPAIEKVATEE